MHSGPSFLDICDGAGDCAPLRGKENRVRDPRQFHRPLSYSRLSQGPDLALVNDIESHGL